MTMPTTFTDAEVAGFQPRARHFYHQAGKWHGPTYMAWIEEQLAAWQSETGRSANQRLVSVADHESFTQFLADRCVCGGAL